MKTTIQGRNFLVGCPRSGTTLLQCFLGAHSKIATFPKSHFYMWLFGGRSWRKKLGIAGRKARPRWNKFLDEIGQEEMQDKLPWYAISVNQYSEAFVNVLDNLTLSQGKVIWLEKTPLHLRFVDQIEKLVTEARFIHMIRNGKDVVASLYDIGNRYSKEWGKDVLGNKTDHKWGQKYQNLDECIRVWATFTRMSLRYQSHENHILVNYEDLTYDPQSELVRLCNFMGISFEEQMLIDYPKVARQVVMENELWKKNAGEPVQTSSSKFDLVFNDEQKLYVLESLPKDLVEIFQSNDHRSSTEKG